MQKYAKNEIVKAKIARISKESKREETKNWARKLIEEFWWLNYILFCILITAILSYKFAHLLNLTSKLFKKMILDYFYLIIKKNTWC